RCDGAAFYAGWYTLNHYNDVFTWNPGAIGIHLDSESLLNPRSGTNWGANAVLKGITITSGAVNEPFLDNLPHPDQMLLYLLHGANVGDALLRSTRLLKWMILNIGDPLYRPFPNGAPAATPPGREVIFGLLPQLTVGDSTSAGIIALNKPAPENGLTFSLKSEPASLVDLPPTVSIPARADNVKFPIHTRAVHEDATTVRIFVTAKDLSRSNTLVLFPLLASPILNPARVRGRSSAEGTIIIHHAAPAGGITVSLSTSNPAVVNVPAEIKIP